MSQISTNFIKPHCLSKRASTISLRNAVGTLSPWRSEWCEIARPSLHRLGRPWHRLGWNPLQTKKKRGITMRQQHGPLWSGICWFSIETSWGEHTGPGPKCRNQKRPMRSPIQPRQEPPPRLIQTIDGRNLASPHISSRAKLLTGRCIRVSKTSNQFHPQPGHGQIKSAGNVAALAREGNFNLAQYEISLTVKRKSWMYLFLAFFSFCQGWKQRRRHPESAPGIERCICVCVRVCVSTCFEEWPNTALFQRKMLAFHFTWQIHPNIFMRHQSYRLSSFLKPSITSHTRPRQNLSCRSRTGGQPHICGWTSPLRRAGRIWQHSSWKYHGHFWGNLRFQLV